MNEVVRRGRGRRKNEGEYGGLEGMNEGGKVEERETGKRGWIWSNEWYERGRREIRKRVNRGGYRSFEKVYTKGNGGIERKEKSIMGKE